MALIIGVHNMNLAARHCHWGSLCKEDSRDLEVWWCIS